MRKIGYRLLGGLCWWSNYLCLQLSNSLFCLLRFWHIYLDLGLGLCAFHPRLQGCFREEHRFRVPLEYGSVTGLRRRLVTELGGHRYFRPGCVGRLKMFPPEPRSPTVRKRTDWRDKEGYLPREPSTQTDRQTYISPNSRLNLACIGDLNKCAIDAHFHGTVGNAFTGAWVRTIRYTIWKR